MERELFCLGQGAKEGLKQGRTGLLRLLERVLSCTAVAAVTKSKKREAPRGLSASHSSPGKDGARRRRADRRVAPLGSHVQEGVASTTTKLSSQLDRPSACACGMTRVSGKVSTHF